MQKRKLFVDMDGTVVKWHPEKSIEEVAMEGYFENLEPMENVVSAVKKLTSDENVEVYILSSVFMDAHSVKEKNIWLNRFIPEIPEERRFFVPYGVNKSTYLQLRVELNPTDILLDDFTKNLMEWHGVGIKLLNGINHTRGTWQGYLVNGNSETSVIANSIKGISMVA